MVNAEHQYNVTYIATSGGWAGHKVTSKYVGWNKLLLNSNNELVYMVHASLYVPVLDIEECKPVTIADVQRSNAGWTYND